MKAYFLACMCLLSAGVRLAAVEPPAPVMNAVSFTGEYVTFSEARAKFRPVHQEQPVYPKALLEQRIEGCAIVAFLVELDGSISQCQVLEATDAAFGESARAAISKWAFSPPKFGGKPGRIAMTLPVEFTVPVQMAMESAAVTTTPQAGS